MSETVMTYTASEVADLLQVSGSTLRKWCIALEGESYSFVRGNNDQRFFTDQNVIVLKRLKHLVQDRKITVNDSVKTVVSMINTESRTAGVRDEQGDNEQGLAVFVERSEYREVIERLDKQEEFNRLLLEKLEQQSRYIENSINKRDEQLMLAMKQSMETQKQLAVAEEQAKPWWKRLFNK
jgi:DNA-binding transcriptional MerR regulator